MKYSKQVSRVVGAVLLPGVLMSAGISQGQVTGELWQNIPETAGSPVLNATIANQPAGAPDAEFLTTSINYDSRLTSYFTSPFLNGPTFFNTSANWVAAGATIGGAYGKYANLNDTYFLFTGKTFLNAGANSFVTPHDDGFELSIPGAGFDLKDPGPTAAVNTPYVVTAPSAGLYDFTLSYGECCTAPAVLGFEINGVVVGGGNVPEVSSTLALLGGAVGLLGAVRYKTRK